MTGLAGRLAGSLAGSLAGGLAGGGGGAVTFADILAAAGASMAAWYEAGFEETLESPPGLYTTLGDLGPGGHDVTQATTANKPFKDVTGGPNGTPCAEINDANDRLVNTTISLSAGRDLYYVVLFKFATAAGPFRVIAMSRTADGEAAGSASFYVATDGTHFEIGCKRNGAAADDSIVTSPALNAVWNKLTLQLSAAAAPVCQINGTNITPALTASVGASDAIQTIVIGHPTLALGRLKLYGLFDAPSAGLKTMIDTYISQQYGL